jgi:hypothetical protein
MCTGDPIARSRPIVQMYNSTKVLRTKIVNCKPEKPPYCHQLSPADTSVVLASTSEKVADLHSLETPSCRDLPILGLDKVTVLLVDVETRFSRILPNAFPWSSPSITTLQAVHPLQRVAETISIGVLQCFPESLSGQIILLLSKRKVIYP